MIMCRRRVWLLVDSRQKDLSDYCLSQAEDSIKVAKMSYESSLYKDSINRSYYAAFYSIKAVLALEEVDFKRHKDVIGYFNKTYVATDKFPRDLGRKIGMLKQLREKSDYDDFYIAGKEEAELQIETAMLMIAEVKRYVKNK